MKEMPEPNNSLGKPEADPGEISEIPENELPPVIAEYALNQSRWKKLLNDPDVRKGLKALGRTAANASITVADVVPGLGETVSWTADALKIAGPSLKKYGIHIPDLSPTVSRKLAVGTELLELPTAGVAFTHAFETFLQLKRQDAKLIADAARAVRKVLAEEKRRYEANKERVDQAIKVFDASNG